MNLDFRHTQGLPGRWKSALESAQREAMDAIWQELDVTPLQAAQSAEKLFVRIKARTSPAAWLAFLVAVSGRIFTLSDFRSLDPLLAEYPKVRSGLKLPAELLRELDAAYFGGLVFRQPDHPQIDVWARRCLEAFEEPGDSLARLSAANYLTLYRVWRGDLVGAESLSHRMTAIRETSGDLRARIFSHSLIAMVRRLFIDYEACLEEVEQGLALAESSGVHFWDSHFHMQGAFLALTRHNLEEAAEWLGKMERSAPPEHYLDRSGYHYSRAWLHLLLDDRQLALQHARDAERLAQKSGAVFPHAVTQLGLAQVQMEQGLYLQALLHLGRARLTGRNMRSGFVRFVRGLTRARVAYSLGMEARGQRVLAQTLAFGNEQRYVNFPWWRDDMMADLFARALAADIEADYVRWIIRQRRLAPPRELAAPAAWYWPLEVSVLGEPRFCLDGQPLDLGGKANELVVALACWGDGTQPVSRERLADLLWPDSEGDRAQHALDTTVHRLRRRLGSERMILSRPGTVALNPDFCQVDSWRLLRELDASETTQAELARLVEAASILSLSSDLLPKSRLRRRIVAKVLTHCWEVGQDEREAWLESLVEIEPANERLWQALIQHHLAEGLQSAAQQVWLRCESALREAGVQPSAQTRTLVEPSRELSRP